LDETKVGAPLGPEGLSNFQQMKKKVKLALQQEISATGAVAEKEWLLGVLGR
jgi:hypothetical protein